MATYIDRVNQPPPPIVAPNANASAAMTREAKERKSLTARELKKMYKEEENSKFAMRSVTSVLGLNVATTGTHAERDLLAQAALKVFCSQSALLLQEFDLAPLFGTDAEPNYQFPAGPTSTATTLEQRHKMNEEFYLFLESRTDGIAHDIVCQNEGDGLAALRALRISYAHMTDDNQRTIQDALRGMKAPEHSPTNFLRKVNLLIEIHDSYGKNEMTDAQKCSVLKRTIETLPKYHDLVSHFNLNPEAYAALDYRALKKMIGEYHVRLATQRDAIAPAGNVRIQDADMGESNVTNVATAISQLTESERLELQKQLNSTRDNNPLVLEDETAPKLVRDCNGRSYPKVKCTNCTDVLGKPVLGHSADFCPRIYGKRKRVQFEWDSYPSGKGKGGKGYGGKGNAKGGGKGGKGGKSAKGKGGKGRGKGGWTYVENFQ